MCLLLSASLSYCSPLMFLVWMKPGSRTGWSRSNSCSTLMMSLRICWLATTVINTKNIILLLLLLLVLLLFLLSLFLFPHLLLPLFLHLLSLLSLYPPLLPPPSPLFVFSCIFFFFALYYYFRVISHAAQIRVQCKKNSQGPYTENMDASYIEVYGNEKFHLSFHITCVCVCVCVIWACTDVYQLNNLHLGTNLNAIVQKMNRVRWVIF